MKRNFLLLTLLALLASPALMFGQNHLRAEYRNAASSPNFLNICGDADTIVVTVRTEGLSGVTRSNITAVLKLFEGVEFLGLVAAQTSAGVSATNISNRNQPVFALPDLSPNGTNQVQIGLAIAANCEYIDSIAANNDALVHDTWTFTYNLGAQTGLQETDATEEYRTAFKVPTFTLSFDQNTPPASKVGDCYSRTLTAANSALEGFVDTLIYVDKLGAGVSLKQLYVNGVPIPFTKIGTSTDTTIRAFIWGQWFQTALKGNGPGDGDAFLDPDERIVVREDICYVSCSKSNLSQHSVAWGCKGRTCTSALVNGFVRKGDGSPNALIVNNVALAENVKVGYCKAGKYVIHYTNNGSEIDAGFATMKDVEVQIGMGIQVLTQNTYFKINKITIAGKDISPIASTTVLNGNALFNSDPDGAGGLSDADGDGFFDDLLTGRQFDLVVDFEFNCDSADMIGMDSLCLNEFNVAWNAYIKYTDPCSVRVTKSLPNFGGIQNTNEEFLNCIDPDAYPGQQFLVQHIETRGVRTFEKSCNNQERLVVWVAPPPGVTINVANARLFKNNSTTATPLLSSSVSNDTTYLFFDATGPFINGKYDFRIYMTPDCSVDAGRIEIPFGIYHWCPPCGCKHGWYCSVLDGPQYHPTVPPCAQGVLCPKGLQTTDFDVERTTFGFNSPAYTTPMNPNNANKNVAIFCDTVKATVCNVVGQTAVTDSFGVVISYDNVDYLKDTNEIFLFRRGLVRIRKTGGQIFNCHIDSTYLTVVRDDTTKTLTFRLDRCLQDLGITLAAGDSVKFYGWFLVNPTGPMVDNFRKVPNFRAYGFAIFDGEEFACDNYGENFFVSKIPTVFAVPGGSEFPRGCSTAPFQYRLVTKNVGFSQYYTGGEYYPAVKVDSLVLDYDTSLVSAFQNLKVEVSIPGHPTAGNNFYQITNLNPSVDKGHYVARFDTLQRVASYNAVTSYSFNLRISATPGCESLTGSATTNAQYKMNPTIYYTDRYFAKNFGDGSCADERTDPRTQFLTYTDPPKVDFDPVTNPNLLLTNDTAEWIIKQCNTSTTADASLTWLAAAFDTAQLQVLSFEVIDNPATPVNLALTNYGNGKVFAVTPGVLRQAANNTAIQICNTIRIRAILKQCGTFPLGLSMGWNCAPYSDPNWNPDEYAPCAFDTLGLTVTALDPALDATVVNQPAEFPSLCDTQSLEVLVRNTGQGAAFDIKTRLSVPLLGAELIPGSVEVAYPSDAAFVPALFDPAFAGNTLRGKFYQYSDFDSLHAGLAANGLPGFDPLSPGGENEFKVRYKFTTGCSFVGGVQAFYAFSGKKACGLPTNSESGESLPIQIAGIAAGAAAQFEVGFDPGSLLAASGTSQLIVFATNVTDTLSDAQDKIVVKLPLGVSYVPGSSIGSNPPLWTPGDPQIETVGGINILSWFLPAGLAKNETALLRFSVNTPALSCENQLEASVLTAREISYTCPGGGLTCSVDVMTSVGGEQFFDLSIGQNENFAGNDQQICPGGSAQLNATVTDYTDYSWSPTDGLSDPTLPNPVATPTQTTTYTVTAIAPDGCARVDQVTVTLLNTLQATANVDSATCGQNNGIILVSATGGSGNYAYAWLPNVSTSASAFSLSPGNYLITVTDQSNGCTDEAFGVVGAVGSAVSISLMTTAATTLNPTGGSISVNISGGNTPYTIAWTGPLNGSQNAVNQSVFSISSLSTGNYVVTVTDANGCSATAQASVPFDVVNNLTLTLSSLPDTSCCYSLGVINVMASGGDGNYSLTWAPPLGHLTNLGGGFFRIDSVEAGTYSVTLTDGLGLTRTGTVTVADLCSCDEIFEEELILVPEGVEGICIGIPYLFFEDYPIYINGQPYTGPYLPCEFDTVVYYAFSFLPGNGFDGPFKLVNWQGNNETFSNVVFQDLYDLVDSMSVWDPEGAWLLDDQTSIIYGGHPYDQAYYGPLQIMHLPTWTPFTVKTNYVGFAYETEIFVSPFDGKVVVRAEDPSTCCADSLCIIFVNPCEDLLPTEPFLAYTDDPEFCIPIEYDSLFNFFVFMDRLSVNALSTPCLGGAQSTIPVPMPTGPHELIVIDTTVWCADTAIVMLAARTQPGNFVVQVSQGSFIPDLCVPYDDLMGDDITLTICELPENGNLSIGLGDTCFTYTPDPGFVGFDTVCIVACDQFSLCDTTIVEIEVTPPPPHVPTERDTFYLTTEINQPILDICLPTNELQSGISTLTICGAANHGDIVNIDKPCFDYVPDNNFAGLDQICAIVCDSSNVCDTAVYVIMVETPDNAGAMPNRDTIYISTPVNVPYTDLCLSTAELTGTPGASVQGCDAPDHGDFVPYAPTCVHFKPDQNFVGLDKGCLYICDNQGNCDSTVVMIMVTPDDSTPANFSVKHDTLYLTTVENTPVAATCVDMSELPGNAASTSYCQPLNGFVSPGPGGLACFRYEPAPGFSGEDQACLIVCDDLGVCDTTTILITVLIDNQQPVTDTLRLSTDENAPLGGICLNENELNGIAASFGFCQDPDGGTVSVVGLPCFTYFPGLDFVGNDTACLFICDAGGLCDTTILILTVNDTITPPPTGQTQRDTLRLGTDFETALPNICADPSEIGGLAANIDICGFPPNGDVLSTGAPCVTYTPDAGFDGEDEFCLVICNDQGLCDTTVVIVTVAPAPPPPVPTLDTLIFTTDVNISVTGICLDLSELPGQVGAIQFCNQPSHGVFSNAGQNCLTYVPDTDFVGSDSACVFVCSGSGAGQVCDTTYIFVNVELPPPPPVPTLDTLTFTTDANISVTGICLDLSELPGQAGAIQFCNQPSHGVFSNAGQNCLTYVPDTDFVGSDSACVFVCSGSGAGQVCDTTYIFVNVELPPPPPVLTHDTLFVTTDVNISATGICLDLSELPGPAGGVLFCSPAENGSLVVAASNCLTYTPATDFVGLDSACVAVCANVGLGLICDTTFIFILVETPTDPNGLYPNLDTIYLSTTANVQLANICLATDELPGPADTLIFCGQPANGAFAAGNDSCLTYTPTTDFVGLDFGCATICDAGGVCDTFVFVILVTPEDTTTVPTPVPDSLFLSTDLNVSIPNICLDLSELPGQAGAIQLCGQPLNGSLSFTSGHCMTYEPNLDFVGLDSACVYVCSGSGAAQVCDTTYIFLLVETPADTNGILPNVDTLYLSTEVNTPLAGICLPASELDGPADTMVFCAQPLNGVFESNSDSCLTYTPNLDFVGTDFGCVTICDAGGDCDTFVLVILVTPQDTVPVTPDCNLISEDTITLEIAPNEPFGMVCIDNLTLDMVPDFEFFDNGQPYANGFFGCNYDSCFAYTYFTVPDFGNAGPYRLDFWYVNGDTMRIDSFQNIQELVDSIHVWDPQGDWALDPQTLTIRTCSATWLNYGDMKITQWSTAGVAEIEINVNLLPQGTKINLTPGQHLFTLVGDDCADSLWVNVLVSNELEIDTFIYLDAGIDTICLADLGIDLSNVTDLQFLCPDASGVNVAFEYDTLTHCLTYDGLLAGIDTFCLKLLLGTDSCLYVTVRATVLEPLPCNNFIDVSQTSVTSTDCLEALACIDMPFAVLSEYNLTDNGFPIGAFPCTPNAQGLAGSGLVLSGLGLHEIVVSRKSQPICTDTVRITVLCDSSSTDGDIVRDTIFIGQTDSLCLDTTGQGLVLFIDNLCPDISGNYVDFQPNIFSGCFRYSGLDGPGTDTACVITCFGSGACDTVLLIVTVLEEPILDSLPPVAVTDFDSITGVPILSIDVLANDTLNGSLESILIITPPVHGTAGIIPGNNHIMYEPNTNFCDSDDPDSLQYVICNPYGCDTAWVYVFLPCSEIEIYDAISPDGDGMNDVFTIEGVLAFPNNHLQVFNRWGARVFDQKGYRNSWGGDWDGKPLPDGVYFYIFDNGEGKIYSGHLVILR